jgi:hypothetical protein
MSFPDDYIELKLLFSLLREGMDISSVCPMYILTKSTAKSALGQSPATRRAE